MSKYCNMKRVLHEKIWKRKKVQHEKRNNMKTVQHEEMCDISAPRKKFRMKRLQCENK